MNPATSPGGSSRSWWLATASASIAVLALERVLLPSVSISAAYALPVALAVWKLRWLAGVALALTIAPIRLALSLVLSPEVSLGPALLEAAVLAGALVGVASLVHRVLKSGAVERARANAELRESERRFRITADCAPVMIWQAGPDKGCTWFNRPWLEFVGRPMEQEVGNGWSDHVHPDDFDRCLATFSTSFDSRQPFRMEYRLQRHDGEYRWILDNGVPLYEPTGELGGYIGSCVDVTELRRAREHLQQVVEASPSAMLTFDDDGLVTFANRRTEQLFGYPREELVGRPVETLVPEPASGGRLGPSGAFLRNPEVRRVGGRRDLFGVRRDGSAVPIEVGLSPIRTPEGRSVLASITDITERLSAAEELMDSVREKEVLLHHAQKMESLGRLAGGVAHDFNNLILVINGVSELLLEGKSIDPAARSLIGEIHRAGERASKLTRQLLAFGRRQALEPSDLDLGERVAEISRMLSRLIGEDIVFTTASDLRLWTVRADPGRIEQVLLNLVVNARDAMPHGGQLRIETRNHEQTAGVTHGRLEVPPGRYVMLSVRDSGAGMGQATRDRAFEPFFTTKEPGEGAGLGLATVYGIVRQSGGFIDLDTEVGRGTAFHIYFPVSSPEAPVAAKPERAAPPARGDETVLLVEDDPAVRSMLAAALFRQGYSVREAGEGEEALRLFERKPSDVQLIVTDIVMPGMSGHDLAERVRAIAPGTRVLFMSGHIDAPEPADPSRDDPPFLYKPFTMAELAAKVREVLDR